MNNLTLDTTSFSEQLGVYDFFNIIVSGSIFVLGICSLWRTLAVFLWTDLSVAKCFVLIGIVYISGLVLQEIGSFLDKHIMKVQSGAHYNFLKDSIDKETEISPITFIYRVTFRKIFLLVNRQLNHLLVNLYIKDKQFVSSSVILNRISVLIDKSSKRKTNTIIHNRPLLAHYRERAKSILLELSEIDEYSVFQSLSSSEWDDLLNENFVNSYVFTVCQYYVASNGKDKKVEKLRALFDMSRSLTACFFVLFLITYVFKEKGVEAMFPYHFPYYLLLFFFLTVVFRFRMNKTIRNMTLIMLGNYDALQRRSNETSVHDGEL